jgi:hypothetical protein
MMTYSRINRRRFIVGVVVSTLALAFVATSSGLSVAVSALVDFAEITERVARFPGWLVDHSRCFSLDRLDPTCPQCI